MAKAWRVAGKVGASGRLWRRDEHLGGEPTDAEDHGAGEIERAFDAPLTDTGFSDQSAPSPTVQRFRRMQNTEQNAVRPAKEPLKAPSPNDPLPEISTRTHLQVFLPSTVRQKLELAGCSLTAGDTSLSGYSDEKGQMRRWQTMAAENARGWRGKLFADAGMAAKLAELSAQAPNFDRLLGIIAQTVRASLAANAPMRLPPLLLLGPPGVGKSFIATRIAHILGTAYVQLSMPTATNGNPLGGVAVTWKTPKIGLVAETLLAGHSASPVILLDEVDKPFRTSSGEQPLDPLHALLETETSRSFKDEYLEIEFDASHVFWLATANDLTSIPPAVLDRFLLIDVEAPKSSQMRVMIEAIVGDAVQRFPNWFAETIADDVIARLSALHPRRLRQVAELSCINAVADGRHALAVDDVDAALKLLSSGRERNPIGFRI